MYISQPFLYFVPLSFSFTILLAQFFLLRKFNFPKKSFIILFALLTIASYMTHVTEAIIFSVFLIFYAFFFSSTSVRIMDSIESSLIGFLIIDGFYAGIQYLFGVNLSFSLVIPIAITGLLAIVLVYTRIKSHFNWLSFLTKFRAKLSAKLFLYVITFVYFIGLIIWLNGIPSFHTKLVSEVGATPWFLYPIFLGA